MTNPDQLSANASRNKMNQIIEDAEVLLLNIADYEPSAGEDDDEKVEVMLGELKNLQRSIRAFCP